MCESCNLLLSFCNSPGLILPTFASYENSFIIQSKYMPHNNEKHHSRGEGVKLIGTPVELIDLMIPGANERKAAIEEVDNEGPKHKQVFSALLLNRLFKMVRTIEKSSGTKFALQEGYELIQEKGEEEVALAVSVPINVGTDLEKKQIADAISDAPEHEALVYAMCLQAIEWTINAKDKK